jgi:hypothetical protein
MAKITLDLNRFKASGVYTIEFDASERIVVTTQTIRLVVGFSRKGPFNAPVFLRDVANSRKVFGTIDTFLEKRGSFFHRAIEICLQTAPVFALNLLPLNNVPVNEGGDAVDYRSFALAADEENGEVTRALLSSFFNKERFWFPDETYLQATVDSKPANCNRLFNFVNLGQEVQSVIVIKSANASLYNVTAEDYFGRGNVPDYIEPIDYVSDYFVDVYVVKGDWTNLPALSQDPLWSKYFDLRGVKADRFFEFLSLDGITLTGSFTGTIIPDFIDNNGANQSIDVIVNSAFSVTGVFCNLNKKFFDDYANSVYKVDPVGNTLINTTDDVIDFLSYNTPIRSTLTFVGKNAETTGGFDPTVQNTDTTVSPIVYVKSYPFGGNKGKFNNILVIPKPYPADTVFTVSMYDALAASLTTNSLIKTFGTSALLDSDQPNDFVKIDNIVDTGDSLQLHLSSPLHSDTTYENAASNYAESNYILKTTANVVPTAANQIVIDNPATLGDGVTGITGTAQSNQRGSSLVTLTYTSGGSGTEPGSYANRPQGSSSAQGIGANFTFTVAATGTFTTVAIGTASGSGYKAGDTVSVAASNLNGATNDLVMTVATVTPYSFTNVASSSGTGSGARFGVSYGATSTRTVTIASPGSGYTVGDTITISGANVGGGSATNITLNVSAVTTGGSITPGDIMLVEAPGYAKYFEVDTVTVGSSTSTVTVVGTATNLTIGSPYYQNKYCVAGFPADEFASVLQPTDIVVSLFDTTEATANDLVPDITLGAGDGFGYISSVDVLYSKVQGLGQTRTASSDNEVVVDWYDTSLTTPDWAGITGTWYILGNTSNPGYLLGGTSAGDVRIVDSTNTNPFFGVTGLTGGSLARITVPAGQIFYGNPNSLANTIAAGTYNLTPASTGEESILSLASYEAYPGNKFAKNIKGNLVIDGDRVKYGSATSQYNYLNVTDLWNEDKDTYTLIKYGLSGAKATQYTTAALLTPADSTFADLNYTYDGSIIYTDGTATNNDLFLYSSLAKDISEQVTIEAPGIYGGGKKFKLSSTNASKLEVGDYVVNNDVANPKLVRVTLKVRKLDTTTGLPYFEYTVLETPLVDTTTGVNKITKFTPIQKFADRYQFTKFSGFSLTDYHLPGTPAQLEKIYGVLENTNLAKTLADKDVITFRYIIDTFNGGLEPNMGPKQILSRLAKNRQKCLALINAPSIAEFQASTDPRFTELPDPAAGNPKPVLNTFYIETGGNLSLGPSYIWGLPDEDQGAKFMGVFSPNIVIRENNKDISIPPAADVSNNFIRKFINGEPYAIVAGPRRGVISNPKFLKLEYDYLLADREHLEPIGINPITVVKNVGPMIFANQTAYQRTLSAFNNLHVRDLLITIEEGIEEILQNYLFEFNDATTRLEIRQIVNTYLDTVRNNGGIFDYSVIMDDTNNTPAIIDQNFGIIDVGIEPSRGIQKFINRITVLKTGTISSGGFSAA